jgi:hypothetical protein
MPATCHYCEVKLFGDEIAEGVCEHCEVSPAPKKRPASISAPRWVKTRGTSARSGVAWGLLLLCWGIIGSLLAALAGVAVVFVGSPEMMPLLRIAGFLAEGLVLVGLLMCCLTHGKVALRTLSWVTAGVASLYAAVRAVMAVVLIQRLPAGAIALPPSVLADFLPWLLLVPVLAVAAFGCTCLFLHALAVSAGARDLGRKFIVLFFAAPLGSLAALLGLAIAAAILTRSPALAALAGMAGGLLFALGAVLWFLVLVTDLRELMKAIRE